MRYCENCGVARDHLLRCGQCRVAGYCNAECQREDWRRRHRRHCGLTYNSETSTNPEASFVYRQVTRWMQTGGGSEEVLASFQEASEVNGPDEKQSVIVDGFDLLKSSFPSFKCVSSSMHRR